MSLAKFAPSCQRCLRFNFAAHPPCHSVVCSLAVAACRCLPHVEGGGRGRETRKQPQAIALKQFPARLKCCNNCWTHTHTTHTHIERAISYSCCCCCCCFCWPFSISILTLGKVAQTQSQTETEPTGNAAINMRECVRVCVSVCASVCV